MSVVEGPTDPGCPVSSVVTILSAESADSDGPSAAGLSCGSAHAYTSVSGTQRSRETIQKEGSSGHNRKAEMSSEDGEAAVRGWEWNRPSSTGAANEDRAGRSFRACPPPK